MFELRPVVLADVPTVTALMTRVHPDEPVDEEDMRHRWEQPDGTYVRRRWMVEREGEPVGFAFAGHPASWPEGGTRYGQLEIRVVPEAHDAAGFDRLVAEAEAWLRGEGAEAFQTWMREDDAFFIAAAERNGYRRDRLSKAWQLDLEPNRERLLALREATREAMRERGIDLLPIDRAPVPDAFERLYRLDLETTEDIPHTVPITPPTFEEWERHLRGPHIHLDRVWTAWRDGEVLALSFLRYPRVGNVWTGYTACGRAHRGQGIARAVKMETLGQAIELGVPFVRTDNDEQNAAMLHINEKLGYHRVPGMLSYLREPGPPS